MEVRLNVRNIDLREAQEKMDNNVRQLRNASRKVLLAYAGLWGIVYDEAMSIFDQSKEMLKQAENRGEKLETEANRRVQEVRHQAQSRVKDVEARVESLRHKVGNRMQRPAEKVEYDLEVQVERVLDRLGIPSRDRIVKLSAEIEVLSQKIDDQLATAEPEVVEKQDETATLPIVDYGKLTAKEITGMLDPLTIAELTAIKRYEEGHENRITVLREVDRRLEAMPIAGYDELTVEEIEPKLLALAPEQLDYLANYEQAHQNRVTLLRAIEREKEARHQPVA